MNLNDDQFLDISDSITNPYITEWQTDGKKVLGHYCTYIPDELLHAAKILPFRMRATGNTETSLADIYMVRFTCSFVRATFDMALRGIYDFLDGILICNSCDHSRRMFELFDLKVFGRENFPKPTSQFYFSVPHVITDEGFEWYYNEIKELKTELEEKYIQETITNQDLLESINIYNTNRELLRKIHEMRIMDTPKISGSEALQISMSNNSVPKEVANRELERILNSLKESEGIKTNAKRIMLVGSEVDSTDFTGLIEDSGALIVSDFLCFGTRNFLDDVHLGFDNDPLKRIVERVYFRMSCPRMMDDHERRLDFIKSELKRANVDGVILQRINNCDLHGCDNMLYVHELKDLEIPVLNLDREFYQADTTRLQTRIEAFLEMI
ncbi:MAG: 2-hydroxyacyl-CoA dehydratase [Candidatus Lokiarchaeota archaeon]|nr:2-hydroxyacyl-CoA dehydratase [Candidatus Lokiarchaeota archaeon]